jgi:hypothetical protein
MKLFKGRKSIPPLHVDMAAADSPPLDEEPGGGGWTLAHEATHPDQRAADVLSREVALGRLPGDAVQNAKSLRDLN